MISANHAFIPTISVTPTISIIPTISVIPTEVEGPLVARNPASHSSA
jgi:hypothetical protein